MLIVGAEPRMVKALAHSHSLLRVHDENLTNEILRYI